MSDQPPDLLLRNARVIDPANAIDDVRDIGVQDGHIADPADLRNPQIVDLSGHVLAPGFIDLHVHLREPGQCHKETIATATAAAAAAGFTTVVAMPNTNPVPDSAAALESILEHVHRDARVRVLPTGAMTRNRAGAVLTDFAELRAAGVAAVTDDGTCIQDDVLTDKAFRQAAATNVVIMEHCEHARIAADGVMNEGAVSRSLGLPGKPRAAEELIASRDAILANRHGASLHLQHLSSSVTAGLLRFWQKRGLRITAEATPHHIALTDEAVREHGTNAKMNPPLCTEEDRQAIIEGLRNGSIAAIATDHAPHTCDEKNQGMHDAPAGVIGLEAAVPICLTVLVQTGHLTLPQLVAAFTSGPADILDLQPLGTLSRGAPADITVLDPDHNHTLDAATFLSKARNCPFHGWTCTGKVAATMFGGRWIHGQETLPH